MLLAVGSGAPAERDGIHLVRLDAGTGSLTRVGGVTGVAKPSYLALHPGRGYLYAVGEDSAGSGLVATFALDPRSSRLALLGVRATGGTEPCHLALDAGGAHVLVANYGSGSVAVLPLDDDGRIGEASTVIAHRGSGPHPDRQGAPHVHQAIPDPSGRFVVVCDLGIDRVVVYRLASGRLTAQSELALPPGSGPRHLAFHPDGAHAYVANELASTIGVLSYDAAAGVFAILGEVDASSRGAPVNYPGAIRVSDDGRFVYVTNRGHDTIAVFAVERANGMLGDDRHHPCTGAFPRDIALVGGHLVCANQKSDTVVSFRVGANGALSAPLGTLSLPCPLSVAAIG